MSSGLWSRWSMFGVILATSLVYGRVLELNAASGLNIAGDCGNRIQLLRPACFLDPESGTKLYCSHIFDYSAKVSLHLLRSTSCVACMYECLGFELSTWSEWSRCAEICITKPHVCGVCWSSKTRKEQPDTTRASTTTSPTTRTTHSSTVTTTGIHSNVTFNDDNYTTSTPEPYTVTEDTPTTTLQGSPWKPKRHESSQLSTYLIVLGAMFVCVMVVVVGLYCLMMRYAGTAVNHTENAPDKPPRQGPAHDLEGAVGDIETEAAELDRPTPAQMAQAVVNIHKLHQVVLQGTNEYIIYVARNIGTANIAELFSTHLSIPKSKYEPQLELWRMYAHSYSDCVINVLKEWQNMKGRRATLGTLVTALFECDKGDIARTLVEWHKQKTENATRTRL